MSNAPVAIVDVEITPNGLDPCAYSVTPVFSGVDRPRSFSWALTSRPLCERLARAVRAGKAISDFGVSTDVAGKTFATFKHHVRGRCMNADLRRLGF